MGFRLKLREPLPDGLKRVFCEQSDSALRLCRHPAKERGVTVHEVRKHLQKLRAGLSSMAVPEPRPGFVDRVLAKASGSKSPEVRGIRAAIRQPLTWWAAGAGALAATLVWMSLLFIQSGAGHESTASSTCRSRSASARFSSAER